MNADRLTKAVQEMEEMPESGDCGLITEQMDGDEAADEYYEEYDEDLQADVDRLYCGDNEDDLGDADDDPQIRVDRVYSEVSLNDELFDVEEVEGDYNDEGDNEQLYEDQDQDQFDDEGNLEIVEGEPKSSEMFLQRDKDKSPSSSSYISEEFSNRLKTLRDTIEYDRVIRSGSSSRENSRGSASNETMQSALRYLQQLATEKCLLEMEEANDPDPDDQSKKSTVEAGQNEEQSVEDEGGFKKPSTKTSPKLVTAFSDQIRKFKNDELARQQQLQQNPDESKDAELPTYVQEMIEKDESLKRLLKAGSVTISQIHESSPPSSPSSTNSQPPTSSRTVTCTPISSQTKQAGNGTKGTLPASVILPPSANSIISFDTVFKPNTDWSQFPSAHKLIEIAALATESAKQDEIKLSVGKHFSALPGGSGGKAKQSPIPGKTEQVSAKWVHVPPPASVGTSSKLFNHIKAPEPKRPTSTATAGFSLITSTSKPSPIPSSATSYLQQLATASKLRNQEPESLIPRTKNSLQNGSGSILNTKLPLKRIISEMLDKEIDDQVPSSSKNFRRNNKELDDGPPEEFDPMRFLEVSLQEDVEDDEYEDDEVDDFSAYEAELPTKQAIPDDDARRKYICPHCLKGFCWSTDLKRHILTHTGERPFGCPHCAANFTRKFLMQKHVKKYHGPSASTEHSAPQLVRTAPNSLLKSNQPIRRFLPNGKLSSDENNSRVKAQNGNQIVLNGSRNGYMEHKPKLGKGTSPSPTTNQQYYKYDPGQRINHILESNSSSIGPRRNSANSSNQIFIKQKHMQPDYDDDDQEEEYEEDDGVMYEEDDVDMEYGEYGLSTGSNNSSNDAEDCDYEEDVNFPAKPKNPIVINISSRNGGSTAAGVAAAAPARSIAGYNNLKVEPRRINQSLVKQLIRANAQIKIAAGTGTSSASTPSSSSRSLLNGNGSKESKVMPPPSFPPSSTIPRLKR